MPWANILCPFRAEELDAFALTPATASTFLASFALLGQVAQCFCRCFSHVLGIVFEASVQGFYGRRIAKKEIVAGATNAVMYVYDGWTVIAVLNQQGQLLESYTRGLGINGDIGDIIAATYYSGSYTKRGAGVSPCRLA